jgi:phosphoesterase RecJ-like protein
VTIQPETDLRAITAVIRTHDRFLLTTHEHPDGDALGSLLGMHLALRALGKDSVMYLPGSGPIAGEYQWMPLQELTRTPPADQAERVLLALDCAAAGRIGDAGAVEVAPLVLNVDHHHDNTRFGTIDLVVDTASSTGEIVRDLLADLGVALTPEIAEPLFVALCTDTGRFSYSNTSPRALRLAAELVEAGADVPGVFKKVYETVGFPKLKLLARVLDRAAQYEDGRVVISWLVHTDWPDVGAGEGYSEGVIEHLRAVEGARLVALIREPPFREPVQRRVSLRAADLTLDVSAIARQFGGGGHPQAAGFTSELTIEELTEAICRAYAAAPNGAA